MKKHGFRKILLATIAMMLVLAGTVVFCVRYTSTRMTNVSFQLLEEKTEDIAREYKGLIENGFASLNSIATLFAIEGISDTQMMASVLDAFHHEEPYVRFQLLTEEHLLMEQDGTWIDVSGTADFTQEVQKAPYVSGRSADFANPQMQVMRQAVPVVQNGEAIAVLYVVLSLQEASKVYQINDFSGNAFVLLVDGTTGNVLLDTWHDTLGNLRDYTERDFMLGDTIEEAIVKMQQDLDGDLAFTSKTRGKIIYLHYEPVGFNHLSTIIGVPEDAALEQTQIIVKSLYIMALIIFVVLVLYMIGIASFLIRMNRRIYQMSITDESTGLLNRSAYETYLLEKRTQTALCAACIYLDANGLHELNNRCGHAAGDAMLRAVADAMRVQWPSSKVYRIGGDEFVVFPQNTDEEACLLDIQQLKARIEEQNYSVSVGFSRREQEKGLDRVVEEADEDMLKNKAAYHAEHDRRTPR